MRKVNYIHLLKHLQKENSENCKFADNECVQGKGHPNSKFSILWIVSQNCQHFCENNNKHLEANYLRNSKTALHF